MREGKFSTYTVNDLRDHMRRNAQLAVSFQPHGGDSFYLDAEDAACELENRGCTVLDDWTFIKANDDAPIRTCEYELPEV